MKRWYKRCGADFIHGTMKLSLEEKGAYSLCLDLMYDHEGPIPDDARWLSGICGVSMRKWNALRARLIEVGKLNVENGFLTNARALFEIENSSKLHRNQVEAGAKGGRKRVENERTRNENNRIDGDSLKGAFQPEKRREEKNKPPYPLEGEFAEFYSAYPRKADRRKAERAYQTARKLATHAVLLAAARAYAAEKAGTDVQFIKLPASWLNAGSWENTKPPDAAPQYSDELWETFLIGWAKGDPWPSPRGPAPNEDGCHAPDRLLSRYLERFGSMEPGQIKERVA